MHTMTDFLAVIEFSNKLNYVKEKPKKINYERPKFFRARSNRFIKNYF